MPVLYVVLIFNSNVATDLKKTLPKSWTLTASEKLKTIIPMLSIFFIRLIL